MWIGDLTLRLRNWIAEVAADGPFGNHETLTDGLVSYWALDETSGTRYDSVTATGNDLTDNNTVGSVNSGPEGVVATFTQANTEQLTRADNADLSLTGAKTWVAWVRPANAGSTRPVFTKRDAGSVEYQLLVDASNTLGAFVEDSSSGSSSFGGSANALIPAGTWNFCVWWYDPADKKIHGHVNLGTEQLGSALTNGPIDGTQAFSIGESASAFWYGGDIARAGVWDRVVSLADLTTLYNAGVGKAYSDLTDDEKVGLVSYWNLDEVSGARYDSHGANDLTDNNTVGSTTNSYPANLPGRVASFVAANSESLSVADTATLDFADDFTVALWANVTAFPGGGAYFQLAGKTGPGEDGYGIRLGAGGAERWRFMSVNEGVDANDGGAGVSTGTWYFLIGYRESGTLKLQVNATVYSGSASAVAMSNAGPFRIGARNPAATEFYDGRIAPVGVWSRVLTAQERTDLFNSGNGLFYGD